MSYYDELAESYDAWHEQPYYRKLEELEAKEVNKYINNNSRILDIGCGTGRILKRILKTNPELKKINNLEGGCFVGIDSSKEMIKKVEKKIKGQFFTMDVDNIQMASENFDVVYSFKAFSHFLNPLMALKEMARVSRKWVIFEYYNAYCLRRLLYKSKAYTNWFTRNEIKQLCEMAGLEVVYIKGIYAFGITPFLPVLFPEAMGLFGSHQIVVCKKVEK